MYQKNCDRCFRPSFSSSEIGIWLCPICKNDLTEYPFLDAMTLERINVKVLPFQKKMDFYQNKLS
ncbi:hypothetical protein KHA94_18625 [Bacillus sp. FJAT-49705]|uniref:Uncharacterized protein n=1 Tax=Cytobacillus citreus TaxID=2833586 RepID=A0ABS5NWH3_9BACI|nr:hypothetical protein [Cytobacillus citreus]MBS4192185.1 hypothetical protein [Cytobacillus citreus]